MTVMTCRSPLAEGDPSVRRGFQRGEERFEVPTALVAAAINEEGGRAGDAALTAAGDVRADAGGEGAVAEVAGEAVDVETEEGRVGDQIGLGEGGLVREEVVVHRPEGALGCGGFGRLGGALGAGVDGRVGEVAEGEAEAVPEATLRLADDGEGVAAKGALE